jgi:hypothetical protein
MKSSISHFYSDAFITKCIDTLTQTPFWDECSDGSIKIDKGCAIRYFEVGLPNMGFHLFNHDGNFIPIQIKDSIIREVDHKDVKSFVQLVMSHLPNGKDIIHGMTVAYASFFDAKILTALPILHGYELLKDSRSTAYRLHSNGAVEIRNDGSAKLIGYDELPENKLVWASNILPRPIKVDLLNQYNEEAFVSDNTNKEGNHFYKWMQNLSKRLEGNKWVYDPETFSSLASGFGYLLHRYWADQKAVCLLDEDPSDDSANGRTGKSLVMNYAMSAALETVIVDGKVLSSKNSNSSGANFKFNSVTPSTQYIGIDDVHHTFEFTNLFNLVTGNITVNKKFGQMFDLKGHDKPKLALSSNHTIKGDGFSYDDRQHLVMVGKFYQYHKKMLGKSPDKLHGGWLFDEEWGETNWAEFDATCINTLRYYLVNGLIGGGPTAKYKLNKLNASVGSKALTSTIHRFLEKHEGVTTYQKYMDGMSDEESDRCLQEFVINELGDKLPLPKLSSALKQVANHFDYLINVGYKDNRKQVRFGDGVGDAVNAYVFTKRTKPFSDKVSEGKPSAPSAIKKQNVNVDISQKDAEELFSNLNPDVVL